jgi:hypothetical protein
MGGAESSLGCAERLKPPQQRLKASRYCREAGFCADEDFGAERGAP